MKKLLIASLSMFLLTPAFAQDGGYEDDGIANERIGLDGSPRPQGSMPMGVNWNHLTTIALSPFQYTENGVGLGLSYERALDQEGYLSLYMPVIATFNINNDRNRYDPYYNGTYYNGRANATDFMVYMMPGVKFYPTGMGKVKYAVGPSAVIGYGQQRMNSYYDMNTYLPYGPNNYYYNDVSYDHLLFGMMINNSLNINATPHLYVGAEMGFGFTYVDRLNGYNYGVKFLTQGAFKIGYTF